MDRFLGKVFRILLKLAGITLLLLFFLFLFHAIFLVR